MGAPVRANRQRVVTASASAVAPAPRPLALSVRARRARHRVRRFDSPPQGWFGGGPRCGGAVEPAAAGRPSAPASLASVERRRYFRSSEPSCLQPKAAERPSVLQRTKQAERAPRWPLRSSARLAPPARRWHPPPPSAGPFSWLPARRGASVRAACQRSGGTFGSGATTRAAVGSRCQPAHVGAWVRCHRFGPLPQGLGRRSARGAGAL